MRAARARSDEERQRRAHGRLGERGARCRRGERRQQDLAFAVEAERAPRRDEQVQAGQLRDQPREHVGAGLDELLEGVEHEQAVPLGERVDDLAQPVLAGRQPQAGHQGVDERVARGAADQRHEQQRIEGRGLAQVRSRPRPPGASSRRRRDRAA